MRARVACALVLFLVVIACADPLYCADGCERDGMAATHPAQASVDCPTCLSALVPHQDVPAACVGTVTQVCEQCAPAPSFAFQSDVDHPPRLA